MRVQELMTPDPITVPPDATLQEAMELMMRNGIHELPVLEDDRLAGILTERDLLSRLGPSDGDVDETALEMLVRDAMTTSVQVLQGDTDVAEACRILATLRISSAPVVDEDLNIVGILSVTDLLSMAAEVLEER